jgi:hypothetical protein
VKTNFPKFW